jgi:hypothetical protein
MTIAMTRLAPAAWLVLVMGLPARAEDYQCTDDAGCSARITEDGELQEVTFRKGDMVSTEAGWVVSPDDGWIKVKTKDGASR